ncbi:MAG: PLP-dependent aminotransferase family protein [Candidatus Thermoplasmatota archaeon]|nr:PLP-dependent aminotransferase family protein [Candidatus Thermoplasmatota archaeon]MCL5881397.1 PLP-dependent aminotransferase family protein [Candidatus Thermoplasmatota archaeon]
MEFKFSDNLKNMKPSEIRELLKYATNKNLISFGGGMPNPETFPMADLKTIMDDVMDQYGSIALQYGNTGGLNELRTEIVRLVRETENIKSSESQVLVTAGSQQGLYELSKILVNPGDSIITEEPTYVGAISAFDANEADMHSIPMDENGLKTELVEAEIKKLISKGKKPKFIYTIPTFQNPTGVTMSLDRRRHLIEISQKYQVPLVEDNPYGELRYDGERIPALKSLDPEVIYLGTFSKIMCPGLRMGFTVAPESFISRVNLLKQALDLSSSTFSQFVAWQYLARDEVKKQIPKTIKLYRRKRDTMFKALEQYFPDGSSWSKPLGGMFLWATVDSRINTTDMLQDAIQDGVAYVSGNAFSPARAQANSMRLNFTFSEDEQIYEGIKRLASVLEKKMSVLQPQ